MNVFYQNKIALQAILFPIGELINKAVHQGMHGLIHQWNSHLLQHVTDEGEFLPHLGFGSPETPKAAAINW